MEVINPFLQENKQFIITFLDEMSVSILHVIVFIIHRYSLIVTGCRSDGSNVSSIVAKFFSLLA